MPRNPQDYVQVPNTIVGDRLNGLQFYPSESIYNSTSSAAATSAEYELIFPPTLGGNLISDSETNPHIIIPIYSASSIGDEVDEQLVIRFFTSSHFNNKHTGSFNIDAGGFNVLSVSSSLYFTSSNTTNIEYRDVFVNPGTKGSAHAILIRNIVHDLITGSSYHRQNVISASKQSNFTSSIHYTNINRGAQNLPILFTGSLSSAESFSFITKSTGSGGLNFSEPTNILTDASASLSIKFDSDDLRSIVFQVGTSSLGYDASSRANNTLLFFSSSGRVGFGTRIPKANVEISGSVKGTKLVTAPSGSDPKPIVIEDSEIKFYSTDQEDPDHPDYSKDKERARIKALPGSFNLIFEVSGSEGYTKSVFISQSGRIGFNTDKPQSEFDARVNEAQFQRPGARKGLKINEEGNIESFNKELASASTGSEFVLRYSRGSTVNEAMMEAATGLSFDNDEAAVAFFNSLRSSDQNEILQTAEELGFNALPSVGDTIGSIRFVAESGSTAAGSGFDDRVTGEAAAITAKVHSVDETGVRGDLIFKVADQTGAAVQRMVLDSGDNHQLSGSLKVGGTDAQGARISMAGAGGNLAAGFFRVGASAADLKIGRMLLHDDGTQKVQISAKGKSFIAGTSGTGTTGTFLGINTQDPTVALQVEGDISASGKLFVNKIENLNQLTLGDPDGGSNASRIIVDNPNAVVSIKNADLVLGESDGVLCNVTANGNITASGHISASGTVTANSFVGTFTGAVTGNATGLTGTPDITVGAIEATSLNVTSITSSIVTSSILQTEGSNIFGDTDSDTHTFNGSITASGDISSSGKVVTTEIESSDTILLDATNDITIDAGGGDIILSDDGVLTGTISLNNEHLDIRSRISNKDIRLKGNDGGNEITAMTVDMSAAGRVGIGTTAVNAKLHLSGSDSTESALRQSRAGVKIWDQAIDSSGRLQWGYRAAGSEGGTRTVTFTLDDNNRIAMGFGHAPSRLLHVSGSDSDASILLEKSTNDALIETRTNAAGAYFRANSVGSSNYYGLELNNDTTGNWFLGSYGYNDFSIVDGAKNSGTRVFTVKNTTGNVGIGTTAAPEKLTVEGNISASGDLAVTNVSASLIRLPNGGGIFFDDGVGPKIIEASNGLEFYANGSGTDKAIDIDGNGRITLFTHQGSGVEDLRIDKGGTSTNLFYVSGSGDIGIGTTDPQKKLDIAGGDIRLDNSKSIFFATTDGNIGRVAITGDESSDFIQLKVDNSNNHILRLNTTGVGIGTSTPSEKLTVTGNISSSGTINLSGSLNFNAANNEIRTFHAGASSGNISINPDGQLNLGSDRTDNVLIGRQNNTGYTTRIFDGTSTIAIKVGNPYVELNVPVTASGDISASGDITTSEEVAFGEYLRALNGFEVRNYDNTWTSLKMTSNGILELASGGNNDRGHLKLHADHGTSPRTSIIEFQNEGTTGSFLFTDASQNLKFHTSDPGEDDSVGNIVLLESSDISTGHITASGDISASGTLSLGEGANFIGGKRFITSTDGFEFRDGTVKALGGIIGNQITASGDISSSGTIFANQIETDQLVSHIGDANTGLQFASDTVVIQGNDENIAIFKSTLINFTENLNSTHYISGSRLISDSDITASGKIVDSTFPSDNLLNLNDDNVVNANGVTLSSIGSMVFMLDSNDTGTADKFEFRADSQDASAGNLLATIEDNGDFIVKGTISASGNITASNIDLPGDNKSITFDNATKLIGDHSIDGFQIRTQDATPIVFKTNGNNIRATIAADGEATFAGVLNSTKLNTGQGDNELYAMNQDVETTDGVQFATLRLTSTTDASATSTGHAFQAGLTSGTNVIIDGNEVMARNNGSTADLHLNPDGGAVSFNNSVSTKVRVENGHITASGDISSSGEVVGLSGSFSVLVGDTSQETSLEVDGPITGSAFRGTKHVLRCETIYINDNPLVQNSVYFGNSLGNQPNNWNDPQAAGGAITSTSTISIAEDDMNWGYILPFDISKVEVQCSLRPALGNGDDFTLAIYTAARQNDAASTNMTITKVANSSGVTFSAAKYVTNDLTYTADLDKGSLIFVGIGSEDATDAKNARGLLNITVTAR